MSNEVVRMHLAQALTRAENTAVRTHLQAALDQWDEETPGRGTHDDSHQANSATAAVALEMWLVLYARRGVPELMLESLLRAYAAKIDARGCVPRSWECNERQPQASTHTDI